MKMVVAIVGQDDVNNVIRSLNERGFSSTCLSTTGGFLRWGNTTLLVGVEAEQVDAVIGLIGEHSKRRSRMVQSHSGLGIDMPAGEMEVTVGGATVFVLDVERFEQL